jgi:hypothetical protein
LPAVLNHCQRKSRAIKWSECQGSPRPCAPKSLPSPSHRDPISRPSKNRPPKYPISIPSSQSRTRHAIRCNGRSAIWHRARDQFGYPKPKGVSRLQFPCRDCCRRAQLTPRADGRDEPQACNRVEHRACLGAAIPLPRWPGNCSAASIHPGRAGPNKPVASGTAGNGI